MKKFRFKRVRKRVKRALQLLLALCAVIIIGGEFFASVLVLPIARNQIEKFTGSEVTIDSIEMHITGLAEIKGLSVESSIDSTGDNPVLTAQRVEAVFSVLGFFTLRPRLESLAVEDFDLDLRYDIDLAKMNLAFFNVGKADKPGQVPVVRLDRGEVKFSKVSGGIAENIFSLTLEKGGIAGRGENNVCGFYFETGESDSGAHGAIGGKWQRGETSRVIINNGRFSTGKKPVFGNVWDIRRFKLDVEYGDKGLEVNNIGWEMGQKTKVAASGQIKGFDGDGTFRLDAELRDMRISEDFENGTLVYGKGLLEKSGRIMKGFVERYSPEGVGDFDFSAEGSLREIIDSEWKGDLHCKDFSIVYKEFPYKLENISGHVIIDPCDIIFDSLQCKHGDVDLEINGKAENYRGDYSYQVRVTSPNMMLGDELSDVLPAGKKKIWNSFDPEGRAKIDYFHEGRFDGYSDLLITADLLGVKAKYTHFPYQLENLTGRIVIGSDYVEFQNVVSASEGSRIALTGLVDKLTGDRPQYNMDITADNVFIDEGLKTALPYQQRKFYDSFTLLSARADVKIEIRPNQVGERLIDYIAWVKIKDALMVYEKYPLPLTDVRVEAVLTTEATFINEFQARNGDGSVYVNGTIWPSTEDEPEAGYSLSINANDIEIQDQLLKSLGQQPYEVFSQLRPVGSIDVAANISERPRVPSPGMKIVIESNGCGINYTEFPYQIDNIFGKITITEDKVLLDNIRSEDADTEESINLNGFFSIEEEKIKGGELSFSASNIVLDERFAAALEEKSEAFYSGLSPAGRFDLEVDKIVFDDGNVILDKDIYGTGGKGYPAKLTLKDCTIGDADLIDSVNGRITAGYLFYDSSEGLKEFRANYTAGSLRFRKRLFEDISGGIVYDPNSETFFSREYTAGCYGGKVLGSLSVAAGEGIRIDNYEMSAIFSGIDLNGLLAADEENLPAGKYTKGSVSGYIGVTGIPGNKDSRMGRLNFEISGMEFAKRSILGKIITASQMGDPTDYIFSDIVAETYLKENILLLENVEIFGKTMQMRGSGFLNTDDGSINADFNAFGKRSVNPPSFIESLTRSLGAAVVHVEVDGTLNKPKIKKTTLPVIRKPFEILGGSSE